MTARTSVANIMRKVGLGAIVDSTRFRTAVRAPVYKRHRMGFDARAEQAAPITKSLSSSGTVGRQRTGPRLTVVVPAYNVAEYFPACLDSILGQSYINLDVLVVNDGSTDSTGQIADYYARHHKRLRVIHKLNAGLGAARNTGIDNSDSEFITFVDSDDTVPQGAYERAMESLLSSGSDVCIGSVSRFDTKNKWLPFWVNLAHAQNLKSVTGREFPPIMWDVFAWNKVYRRSTWDRIVGKFPEGTLYEDQECTARLFAGDARLDILKDVSYNWRLREDNSSITQQKTNVDDLSQRLNVIFKVRDIIEGSGSEYLKYWYVKTLGEDLFYYIREVPRASTEFFDMLSAATTQLWREAPTGALEEIQPIRRLLAYYASHFSRSDLTNLLVHLEQTNNAFRGVVADGEIAYYVHGIDGGEFQNPPGLAAVSPDSFSPVVEVESYVLCSDGGIEMSGYAFVRYLDAEYGYSADLYNPDSGSIEATLEVEGVAGTVPSKYSDFYNSYNGRRFRIKISRDNIDEMAGRLLSSQSSNFELRLHVHVDGFTWTESKVKRNIHSFAGYPPASRITDRYARIAVQGDPRQKTEIVVLKPSIVAQDVVIDGDELLVRMHDDVDQLPLRRSGFDDCRSLCLMDMGSEVGRARFVESDGSLVAKLPLPAGHHDSRMCIKRLDVQVVSGSGKRWALAINESQASNRRDRDFVVSITGFGFAVVDRPLQAASAESILISADGKTITVSGTFALDAAVARTVTPTLALVGDRRVLHPSSSTIDHRSRTFDVEFSLVSTSDETGSSSIVHDRYIVQLLLETGKLHPAAAWVSAEANLQQVLPRETLTPGFLISTKLIGTSRSIRLDISDRLDPDLEVGKRNQALNADVYIAPRGSLQSKTMLFESFGGSAVADSPLAIDREVARSYPDVSRIWTVKSPLTPVPEGSKAVIYGSRAWFEATSSARVLVNNNNFPYFFRKHPDQFYLQTWHGTPLKRIGNHVPSKNLSLSYRQLVKRESEQYWDLLLAQSEEASDTLREAFGYDGSMFAMGYPRNDVLGDVDSLRQTRAQVRRRLGIHPEQRVVLYAPTWRDNLKDTSGHYSAVDFFDVSAAAGRLGSSTTILYRGHANSLNAAKQKFNSNVIDASFYPDVNGLIAASDVLITDYSSIMFDYVVTGKPIVLLCPDLDEYRDAVRGFYYDFERIAPGPIVKSKDEAIDLLLSDRLFTVGTTERYVNFVRRFASYDDGNASHRLLNELSYIFD